MNRTALVACGNRIHHEMPGSHGIVHHHVSVAQVRDCFMNGDRVYSVEECAEVDDILANLEVENLIEDEPYYEADCY